MRIALISSRFFPQLVGSGTSAYTIANSLARRGHEVTVLTDKALEPEHQTVSLPFQLRYVPDLEAFATGTASLKTPLESLHVHLGDIRPDVLHVCNFMPMLLVNILRPSIKCPVIFTFFNTPDMGRRAIGYSSIPSVDVDLARYIIKNHAYDKLIVGSEHYLQAARHLGANEATLQLSYLGVDDEPFLDYRPQSRQPLFEQYIGKQLTGTDQYILLPSRITRQKGIIEAIDALAAVRHHYPVKLLLTGMYDPFSMPYAQEVLARIDLLGLHDAIITPLRHIPRNILPHFFAHAQLTIVPSYYEGLGMAAIESQLIGTPLIVCDTAGLDEVVTNNQNGLTCKTRNAESLAGAITYLLDNPSEGKRLAVEAKRTSKKFNTRHYIDNLERTYSDLTIGTFA